MNHFKFFRGFIKNRWTDEEMRSFDIRYNLMRFMNITYEEANQMCQRRN